MKNIKGSGLWLFLLVIVLTACASQTPVPSQVNAPAISVDVTKDNCPSIEAQSSMQISWTNNDTVDLVLWIEHKDENGEITEAGGTDLLQPGTMFSISNLSPGEYTYYCSKDRTVFGTITISQ